MSSDFRTLFINYMTLQRFSPHTQKELTHIFYENIIKKQKSQTCREAGTENHGS